MLDFHYKLFSSEDLRGRLKPTHLRCDAVDGSEIRCLHPLSLVVYPAIYLPVYIPRGFLVSTGYLCFLCGISSKSRMTVAHRMTGYRYHDTTNGKPTVTWKVSAVFFGRRHRCQCEELLQVKLLATLKCLTLPTKSWFKRFFHPVGICKAQMWEFVKGRVEILNSKSLAGFWHPKVYLLIWGSGCRPSSIQLEELLELRLSLLQSTVLRSRWGDPRDWWRCSWCVWSLPREVLGYYSGWFHMIQSPPIARRI